MLKKIAIFTFLLSSVGSAIAAEYRAAVNIDPETGLLTGSAVISADKKSEVSVNFGGFYDVSIDGNPLLIKAEVIDIPMEKGTAKSIGFKKRFSGLEDLSEDVLSIRNFVPAVSGEKVSSTLSVTLPRGFEAVTSADKVSKQNKNNKTEFVFSISEPVEYFDLTASKNYSVNVKRLGEIELATYFFKENAGLSKKYLDYAALYIDKYSKLLESDFPYGRFAIVEHKEPFGYAEPTYTVMGSSVIALPFIPATSLGHEILHQWFGSAIRAKDDRNWYEALTTYFSDMENLKTEEDKRDYRKNLLISYSNYVGDNVSYPLKDFRYNDSKASQSVGYGKGSMILSMLRLETGDEKFMEGIRRFVKNNMYGHASWDDIFASFDLENPEEFKEYWLDNASVPEVTVSETEASADNGRIRVKFKANVTNGPKRLALPYSVTDKYGTEKGLLTVEGNGGSFSVPVRGAAAKVVVDPDYEIMRKLLPEEYPATFSGVLASTPLLGINDGTDACAPLFEALGVKNVKSPEEVSINDAVNGSLIVCGFDNPASKIFTAGLKSDKNASSEYAVFKNPHAAGKYVMAVRSPAPENIRLLSHYGKYSRLKFAGAKNIYKETDASHNGIPVFEGRESRAIDPRSAKTLDEVVKVAALYPAIFIGERHDNYAHHANQLEIIKRLAETGAKPAIGFEMVQKQFQPVLDDFVNGRITEEEFVKGIDYYNRWGFDYNLYAPLFRYARDNKIPAVALNIDGGINRKISRGEISDLTPEEIALLPREMNTNNPAYEKELREIFGIHPPKADSKATFGDFYLAQNVWDEVMAETAAEFHKNNPDRTLVIIAGSGHLRKDAGIPLRYERRTGKKGFVILQDDTLDPSGSDVVLYTEPLYSDGTPKLGVTLSFKDSDNPVIESVDKESPALESDIRKGDVLLSCEGRDIKDISTLRYALFEAGYGTDITCTVKRGNRLLDKKVHLKPYDENAEQIRQIMRSMSEDK